MTAAPDYLLDYPIAFARDTNKTLSADYPPHWLTVRRAGKSQRHFYGRIDGKIVVRGKTEQITIERLIEVVLAAEFLAIKLP